MQCRWLIVWRVHFYFNTLSCLTIFPEGTGVYKIVVESEGVGGQKMEIPGRRGAYVKFPPWWGIDIF